MKTIKRRINAEESGQALIEFAMAFVVMCVMVTGIIDFGRAFYDVQVMKNVVGEGSSMASRGTPNDLAAYVQAVINDAGSDLSLSTQGCVYITIVGLNSANNPIVTAFASQCGISVSSKVCGGTCTVNGAATIPPAALNALKAEPSGSSIAATEVFYNFSTVTGITNLLGKNILPSQLYAVAYY